MVLAGFLGFRWVKNNLGMTWSNERLVEWSTELIGTAPPPEYDPVFGMYAGEDQREAMLIFIKTIDRGSEISLMMLSRPGDLDFESAFQDVDTGNEGVNIKFESKIGEGEEYFATWGDVQVPVNLQEGYIDGEVISRQVTGIIPLGDHSVVMFFQGSPEDLDRDIIQEMLDRIPPGWEPTPLPPAPAD